MGNPSPPAFTTWAAEGEGDNGWSWGEPEPRDALLPAYHEDVPQGHISAEQGPMVPQNILDGEVPNESDSPHSHPPGLEFEFDWPTPRENLIPIPIPGHTLGRRFGLADLGRVQNPRLIDPDEDQWECFLCQRIHTGVHHHIIDNHLLRFARGYLTSHAADDADINQIRCDYGCNRNHGAWHPHSQA